MNKKREAKRILIESEGIENPRPLAEQSEADAQFALYLDNQGGPEGWKWLCLAASQGHGKAQATLGHHYRRGLEPVEHNNVEAYRWYTLAIRNGSTGQSGSYASGWIGHLAHKMPPAQIAEGERLAAEWKPDPSMCEVKAG